jgi:hypothetical protein|nr:MAG TPA: hypothetical protein [Caudoviricetes sp.]DAU12937.1 MAG TPA: hypothetical protein [Caudoviricetes sp.]
MKRDFALILPNGKTGEHEVQAVTLFENPTDADMTARKIYGPEAYAKESSRYVLRMPSIVKDGVFYNVDTKEDKNEHGEVEIVRVGETPAEYIPSEAEQIAELTRKNAELKEVIDTLVLDALGGV